MTPTRLLQRLGRLALMVVLIASSALVAVSTSPASPANATTSSARAVATYSSFDNEVLAWTNYYRKRHGRVALRMTTCETNYAAAQARYMASYNVMRHQNLTRVMRNCHRRAAAENVAYRGGSLTGKQVVQMWMRSSGHRANILNRGYRYMGAGAYKSSTNGRVYAAQVFGR